MATGLVEALGGDVFCSIADVSKEARFPLDEATPKLRSWAERYDRASQHNDEDELAAIGREMFGWLDRSGWASAWADALGEDRALEVKVTGHGGADETALLDAPWELLAPADGPPLALDAIQLFIVARRVGDKQTPFPTRHADLQVMFMAAAPQGQQELNFEAEEAAILEATRWLPLRLVVEETGNREFLGERLCSDEGPFEALHLSCHGDIDAAQGPILLLETAEGGEDKVGPGAIVEALGADPPPLVVLSACRTAEFGRARGRIPFTGAREGEARRESGEGGLGPQTAAPFARQLAGRIANVVGWDGSVYDADASEFATCFYRELASRSAVPRAAAIARRELLRRRELSRGKDKDKKPMRGQHWHLARVYLGPRGGAALCAAGKPRRQWDPRRGERAFLDKEKRRVPVATREEFVGRRRAIQAVLLAFRNRQSGVLIHGMGALGKSSLAARVENRMPQLAPVVIFESYDALAIFDAVISKVGSEIREDEERKWRERVRMRPAALGLALESWLAGPLDERPVLLIVDDLERILETPKQSDAPTGVEESYREVLKAVLSAFDRTPTRSRLIVTSRYDFALSDSRGGDCAAGLVRVPLRPMERGERVKQWRAAEQILGALTGEIEKERAELLSRALEAASGNPGLQAILTRPIVFGELIAARTALDQIDAYRQTGVPPEEIQALIEAGRAKDSANALVRFFARASFATYRDALTDDQRRQLSAATLFSPEVPIPLSALGTAGQALGVEAPGRAIRRLIGLGLLDDWGEIAGAAHAAANPLSRPLAESLDANDRPLLARRAMPELVKAWRNWEGDFPGDARGLEAADIALAAGAEPGVLEGAVYAGAAWLDRIQGETRAARALIAEAIGTFPGDYAFGPRFLRLALECASALGDAELIKTVLAARVRPAPSGDPKARTAHASFDLRRAEQMMRAGRLLEAESLTQEARDVFRETGDDRDAAIASGQIADIFERCGELDEALRIRREEAIPIFERLGDARERAVTMGKIADILSGRGELDEALRIRREEELPVYERLGDAHSRAMTMSQIAAILSSRGELAKALRILQEERPVYERLGDPRAYAVTMSHIADILYSRDELDEALRIRREEELPVFERLHDLRSRAVTMGKIADILYRRDGRGDLDEALRIRREEELPVYERLRDLRTRAVTIGKIADILVRRGELDEALRIRREEELPVYERLGEARERSVVLLKIAQALLSSGGLEAGRVQEIYDELAESYAIAVKLGLPDVIGAAGALLAQVLARRGNRDDALAALDQAEAAFAKVSYSREVEHVKELRELIKGS